ncbi:hypothetical protein V6N12_041690 [Hibiscus sabdariffa]|uniref:RNase H type-1 domain-containing protein n=1 Tax=Hibiscus sabdariffa TaxID=183260 RepID=A0ABR2BIN6_9ROSI
MVVITPQIQVKLLVEVLVQGQFNALLWALLGSMSCLKKSIMSNLSDNFESSGHEGMAVADVSQSCDVQLNKGMQAEGWDLLFGSILWNTWLRRNQRIFNPDGRTHESLISQSYRMWDEARSALSLRYVPCCVSLDGSIIRNWCKSPASWIKVNTDGARDPNSGAAFCGGVGRDSNMKWCFGFSKKFGICLTFDVELWAVYEGLVTAWSLRFMDPPTPVLDLLNGDASVGPSSVSC